MVGGFFYGIGMLLHVVGTGLGIGTQLFGISTGAFGIGFSLRFNGIFPGLIGLALFFLFLATTAQQQAGGKETSKAPA